MAILTRGNFKASHWYTPEGEAMHRIRRETMTGQGDEWRNTTLGDARKLGLFPSVTGILDVFAKPGLDTWKLQQVAAAALRTPKQQQESVEYWAERVKEEAFRQVDEAADMGSKVHDAMEHVVIDGTLDQVPVEIHPYVKPALEWIRKRNFQIEHRESIIVNAEHGFAGTFDLGGGFIDGKGNEWKFVLDYKTRRTKPGVEVKPYDFQSWQIAAYGNTLYPTAFSNFGVWGINLYISSTEPGRIDYVRYTPEKLVSEFQGFAAACTIWRLLKGYDPREWQAPAPDPQAPLNFTGAPAVVPASAQSQMVSSDAMDADSALPPGQLDDYHRSISPGMAVNPMNPAGDHIPRDIAATLRAMPPGSIADSYQDFLSGRSGKVKLKLEAIEAKKAQTELKLRKKPVAKVKEKAKNVVKPKAPRNKK